MAPEPRPGASCPRRPRLALLLLLPSLLAGAGCGKKGPPLPPLGRGPAAPAGVQARQQGSALLLEVPIPTLRANGTPLEETPSVLLLRSEPGTLPVMLQRIPAERVDASPGTIARIDVPLDVVFDGVTGPRAMIQVQLEGAGGRRSDLSEAIPVAREDAPPAPQDVRVADHPDGMRITWRVPAPSADRLEYNVYRRAADGIGWGVPRNAEPISSTEFLDHDVSYGSTYVYQIRAVVPGIRPPRESAASPAVEITRQDRFAPGSPTDVRALAGPEGIRVFWFPPPDADLVACRVYRREAGEEPRRLVEVAPEVPYFLDADVTPGESYTYTVTAIDSARPVNESPPSDPATERAWRSPAAPETGVKEPPR